MRSFFALHPVQTFNREGILLGKAPGLSCLKGTLHTSDRDYTVYATIYNGKVEQFDLD